MGRLWYKYGTPQRLNREDCPCSSIKCGVGGDGTAFCNSEGTDCVCSSNFLSSGGVCVPAYPPTCCETEWIDEAAGEVLIKWCAANTSFLDGYELRPSLQPSIVPSSSHCLSWSQRTTAAYIRYLRNDTNEWYSVTTNEVLDVRISCTVTHEPTESPVNVPTESPITPATAFCPHLIIVDDGYDVSIVQSGFDNDGRPQWGNGVLTVAYYSFLNKWTFDDSDKFWLAPSDQVVYQPDFNEAMIWSNFYDSSDVINITLKCTATGPTFEQIGFAMSKTFYQGNGNLSCDLGLFINNEIDTTTQLATYINGSKFYSNRCLFRMKCIISNEYTMILASAELEMNYIMVHQLFVLDISYMMVKVLMLWIWMG